MEFHNRRLAKHLTTTYKAFVDEIEGLSELDGVSATDYATVAAGAFVLVTSVMFFVIPVATLGSWPVVATLGTGAPAVAWIFFADQLDALAQSRLVK